MGVSRPLFSLIHIDSSPYDFKTHSKMVCFGEKIPVQSMLAYKKMFFTIIETVYLHPVPQCSLRAPGWNLIVAMNFGFEWIPI